ncbi:MAG TPA: hypothetical protein VFV38_20175 [Ktedonobacteraceae bacterium]|nr:hypothetical protein [Ktedonobacteraceae bacterium]
MATPTGKRQKHFPLATGDDVIVYSTVNEIFLQLRREVPTQQDILAPSFKTAVSLTENEALALAHELISILVNRRSTLPEKVDEGAE